MKREFKIMIKNYIITRIYNIKKLKLTKVEKLWSNTRSNLR